MHTADVETNNWFFNCVVKKFHRKQINRKLKFNAVRATGEKRKQFSFALEVWAYVILKPGSTSS